MRYAKAFFKGKNQYDHYIYLNIADVYRILKQHGKYKDLEFFVEWAEKNCLGKCKINVNFRYINFELYEDAFKFLLTFK